MGYDRKLKNAVAQSVIELVAREGLHLDWGMQVLDGAHVLVDARVRGKQAAHLGNLGLFEKGQGEREKKPAHRLTETLSGPHLAEMAATLFAGRVAHATDAAALPRAAIDWQRSAAPETNTKQAHNHPQRPPKPRIQRPPLQAAK